MNRIAASALAVLLAAGPSISYFKYRRPMQAMNSSGQHYVVVDESFRGHARPDLQDVRLYVAGDEVPYKLTVESGGSETEQKPLRVLQPAAISGKTQFLLDMSGVEEYDRIHLRLSTKNFVAHARVEGQDNLHGNRWGVLVSTTLYDLSDEKLGSNSTLQIPLSSFRYLRVTVDSAVKPSEIQGGTAGVTRSQKAVWRELSVAPKEEQHGKDTVLTFAVARNTPVERLTIETDAAQRNFRRDMEIRDEQGRSLGTREISRIHMLRNGQKVDVEENSVELCGNCQGKLLAVIHNGDDPPLKITSAKLLQYERRIYFDASAGAQPCIYYGDDKLHGPEYDYAKLFQKNAQVESVALNSEEVNSVYSGRPDERPWSERHPLVLWAAILAAVAILGGVAVRSLPSAPKPAS